MLWFTGDINYCDGYFDTGIGTGSLIKKGLNPLRNLPHNKDDFWIGNFEGVCSSESELEGINANQFIINPDFLKDFWHPQIYSVANNHVMQHGEKAYHDMLFNIESFGSNYVGTNEKRSIKFKYKNKNITITSFSQRPENFKFGTSYWSNPDYCEIQEEYKRNVEGADFKVVYIHWGIEFMNYPYIDQRQFAHWLIDLGYDLIVGMHPHVLQGYEIYKGKYIFYSLGNTVFNMAWYKTKYGALIKVDFNGDKPHIEYDYIQIENDFSPKIINESEVPQDCRFSFLNPLINHNKENEKYYAELRLQMKKYRKANYKKIIKDATHLKPTVIFEIFRDFLKRHI